MVLKAIKEDLQAVFDRDQAATSWFEVVLTYAGFHAMLAYRVSHWLKIHGVPVRWPTRPHHPTAAHYPAA
jgi:serine O-acetyltransferase